MIRKNETGQVLVTTALALFALLGFAGLAMDMGVLRYDKRLQQTAADAAAIAGASNLAFGGAIAAGQNASAANDFADNSATTCAQNTGAAGCITVTINNPPASGPHTGDANYVEALVADVQPTYFMKVLGINSELITARAVATNWSGGAANACLFTLGLPASSIEGVNINGNATLNAPTCGVMDNGNYNTKGNALNVSAASFGVQGSPNVSGPGGTVLCGGLPNSPANPCPVFDTPVAPDPLSYMTAPPLPAQNWGSITTSGTQNLSPGVYSSLTIGSNSVVTMQPGLYYFNGSGGLQFNGSATLTGSGVMFYFTGSATINAVGGGNQVSNIQLTAMTAAQSITATGSAQYAGILMYQDPLDTNTGPGPNKGPTLGGTDNSFFSGALYFPKDQLMFFGNSTGTGMSIGIVVADAIALSGHPTVTLLGTGGMPPGVNLIKNAVLVE